MRYKFLQHKVREILHYLEQPVLRFNARNSQRWETRITLFDRLKDPACLYVVTIFLLCNYWSLGKILCRLQ